MNYRTRATPLLATLAVSVLAHAITLSGGWLQLPQTPADPPPLLVTLQPLAPVAVPVKRVPRQRVAKATSAPRARHTAAAPTVLVSDAPAPWSLPLAFEPATVEPEAPAVIEQQPEQAESTPEPVVVATAAPSTFAPEAAIIKTLPRRGRIAYNLNYYLSDMPTFVGRTVQTWEAVDSTYTLESVSETVGLARLFSPHESRTYHSSGQVTERGLLPQYFTAMEVKRGVTNESAAQFDWDSNLLRFGRAADQKNTLLPAGSQDLLSFMYQLSLAPPARGRIQIPITTGTGFENRELDVLDEETLETPLGPMRVLPIKEVRRQGSESIEVYLAIEYRYLPVRIQILGRDGVPGGEQIVTAIHIE